MLTNRLINETSPYLLQHAHNPVDWYPWGPEALERARAENKPILLSIGYSACHWCHVMEHESFEDPEIAGIMNERFVCIKVDREERPDLDSIYMDALQTMTSQGGWPMTMILTPEAKPFFGGTYFPPDERHGLPSFRRVLDATHDAWNNRKEEINRQTSSIVDILKASAPKSSNEPLSRDLIVKAASDISGLFDRQRGGTAGAPKFPQAPMLEFLLRVEGGAGTPGELVELTLRRMAMGGIYDQLGGGFARYSVDAEWLVPHFEKMLYDNAQLARLYTHAWQASKSPLFRRIAIETLEYLLNEMRDPSGGFYSSEDADSEGEEGKFYVWKHDEFTALAKGAADYYGVTDAANFEGATILTAASDDPPAEARRRLLAARSKRIRPARDEKILTSWNALTIGALAEAGAAFDRPDFVEAASKAAGFLQTSLLDESGRLLHSYKDGRAKVLGMLEDYSYFVDALLTLWEVTLDSSWLESCLQFTAQMVELFWDKEGEGFYSTGSDHEDLIARPKELIDGATPSPAGVAALTLQRLAVLTGQTDLQKKALVTLRLGHALITRVPQVTGSLLAALDFYLATPKEIVLIGDAGSVLPFQEAIWSRFLPNKIVAGLLKPGLTGEAFNLDELPLLEGKSKLDGRATAFVCENYACRAPTTDAGEFERQLDST